MMDESQLKEAVRSKYAAIAVKSPKSGCCGSNEASNYSMIGDAYQEVEGHVLDADLNLGCGLPTQFAKIRPGQTVVDLGCGAGNDAFIARRETGEMGSVIGIDFTSEMIAKAKLNNQKLGFDNVTFVEGSIEAIPLNAEVADVVVSNCVFNLIPNKKKAFEETYRILKYGGHFSISDIVVDGAIPRSLQEKAEVYAGCVSGAIQESNYLALIKNAGFLNHEIQKRRKIDLPLDMIESVLSPSEMELYTSDKMGIYSITVYAEKR